MNIRTDFNWKKPYHQINREERNICAILYYLLQINDNLETFLRYLKVDGFDKKTYSIYFEYSFLRDIWSEFKDEKKKQIYILDTLKYPEGHELRQAKYLDFNKYFGAGRNPSENYIQSPGTWAISKYSSRIKDNNEFIKATKFKWCFNAKPDIVIHLGQNRALCIEAKFKSGIGKYPSSQKDKKIFASRNISTKSQLETQINIFKLLDIKCDFFILAINRREHESHRGITWKEVFELLNLNGAPKYILEWTNRFINKEY